LRDFAGGFGDKPLNPTGYIEDSGVSAAAAVVQLGSMRAGALGLDRMRELAVDEYAMMRDIWVQRRKAQIAQQ
jgi:phospholipid-binding lipoprotein MlaA